MTARGEAGRRYRERNREAINRYMREYRARNRKAINQQRVAKAAEPESRERKRERARKYRLENREAIRQQRAAKMTDPEFRERERERGRRYRQEGRKTPSSQRAHGVNYAELVVQMLERQGGCCYLCGEVLTAEQAVIDHDHRCCPKSKSCSACRRGLACHRCNLLIGMADDNPDLLRLIAGHLEAAVKAAEARIASNPAQLTMYPADPTELEGTGAP